MTVQSDVYHVIDCIDIGHAILDDAKAVTESVVSVCQILIGYGRIVGIKGA